MKRSSLLLLSIFIILFGRPAIAQEMPRDTVATRSPELVEIVRLDPTIKLDIRYARTDNFVGRRVYTESRAFLQRPAAEALIRVHRGLAAAGYGVTIFDGYRPWSVTRLFWKLTPRGKKNFVANPAKGSRHNRGCAVDLTLYDRKTGRQVAMPSGYDEMSERAYPYYLGGTPEERRLRDLLRTAMEAEGFVVNEYEWWHFDYREWREYPILDIPFDKIKR